MQQTKTVSDRLSSEQLDAVLAQAKALHQWITQCQGSMHHWQGPHLDGELVAIVDDRPNSDLWVTTLLQTAIRAIGATPVVFSGIDATCGESERFAGVLAQDAPLWSLVIIATSNHTPEGQSRLIGYLPSESIVRPAVVDISYRSERERLGELSVAKLMALTFVLVKERLGRLRKGH